MEDDDEEEENVLPSLDLDARTLQLIRTSCLGKIAIVVTFSETQHDHACFFMTAREY